MEVIRGFNQLEAKKGIGTKGKIQNITEGKTLRGGGKKISQKILIRRYGLHELLSEQMRKGSRPGMP